MMSSDETLVRELKEWLCLSQRDGGGIVAAEGLIRRVIPVLSVFSGAKRRAYRQARIFEPSMDGYHGAMATYVAAFGEPNGEIGVLTTDGEKQPWEFASPLHAGAASKEPVFPKDWPGLCYDRCDPDFEITPHIHTSKGVYAVEVEP